jgi:hypothetical protein
LSISPCADLIDVAFAVGTALDRIGVVAVLTGGSAASFYAPSAYMSRDADFILQFVPDGPDRILDTMATLGFRATPSRIFEHPAVQYTVEFPRGPLAIGRDLVRTWSTYLRPEGLLHVLTPTDCVRDRFLHYYAWGDFSGLTTAVAVARLQASDFDRVMFRAWALQEHEVDRSYDLGCVETFFRYLDDR